MKKIKEVYQSEVAECGLASLTMILNYYGKEYSLQHMRDLYLTSLEGVNLEDIINVAEKEGLNALPFNIDIEDLYEIKTPCIAHWDNNHFLVIEKVKKNKVIIVDPSTGKKEISFQEFSKHFTGYICEFEKSLNFSISTEKKEVKNSGIKDFIFNLEGLKGNIINIFIVSICVEFFIMFMPLFNKIVVDYVIIEKNKEVLFGLGIGFIMLALFKIISEFFRNYMILFLTTNLQYLFKYHLINKLLKIDLSFLQKRGYGGILSKFDSLEEIRTTLANGLIENLVSGLAIIVTGSLMFYLNSFLFSIVLFFILILFLVKYIVINKIKSKTSDYIEKYSKETGMIIEILKTNEVTKGHAEEDKVFKKWYELFTKTVNSKISLDKTNVKIELFEDFIMDIQKIVIVWLGAGLVIANQISIGVLFAFIAYQLLFTQRVYIFIKNIFEFKLLKIHIDRVNDILIQEDEKNTYGVISKKEINDSIKGKIEIRNLYFKFPNKEDYLFENLNIKIEAGESVVFTGKSGSGKSTLLKIIAGLIPFERGDILIDGMNIKDIGLSEYRKKIGLVLQSEEQLYSATVKDNITLFKENALLEDIYIAAKKACIHEEIIDKRMRYETIIGDFGNTFSGGQIQRLILARALYRKPKILFIDEGTSALDIGLEKEIIENLKKENMTRISVAHREESIKLADRVIDISKLKER